MKKCFKCGLLKEKSEFYKHSKMKDGLLGKCKDCTKSDVKENRESRQDYYREYEKKRGASADRKAKRIAWAKEHKKETSAKMAFYRHRKREGMERGICSICEKPNAVAHHPDYDLPLDVVWLCPSHHRQEHLRLHNEG